MLQLAQQVLRGTQPNFHSLQRIHRQRSSRHRCTIARLECDDAKTASTCSLGHRCGASACSEARERVPAASICSRGHCCERVLAASICSLGHCCERARALSQSCRCGQLAIARIPKACKGSMLINAPVHHTSSMYATIMQPNRTPLALHRTHMCMQCKRFS